MNHAITDELELLFEEVCGLAACLRESTHPAPGVGSLSRAAHGVLRLLQARGSLTVPQLARLRGTSRQSMQVLVDRMAGKGWIDYAVNPDHQRSERLRLTGPGEQTLESVDQRHATRLAALLPHVGERSLRSTIVQLRRIRGLIRVQSGRGLHAASNTAAQEPLGIRAPRPRSQLSPPPSSAAKARSKAARALVEERATPANPAIGLVGEEDVGMESLPVTLL